MSEVVSKKTIDEIVEEINQLDINEIELDPKAQEFLSTVEAYLNCFDELQKLYEEVDLSHRLANYEMPDIKLDIQQVSSNGVLVKNQSELYEVAKIMFPVFESKIEGLLEQVASSSHESSNIEFKLPPGENKLKGKERASEKAQDDYSMKVPGPPESWLYDIVRGSVLFDNAEKLFQFLEVLRADESIVIVKCKNRFRNPTLSGYRDFNLQIQITNDDENMKHICELQLHINAIKVADTRLKSHDYYEFFRNFYAGATHSLRERMDDLRVICKGGSLDVAFLAHVLQNPLEADHMTRLADLFATYMNEYKLAIMITNATRRSLEPQTWYERMATILQDQGKLEEAMKMHQKALEIRLKTLGPYHSDVANSYNNMAEILRNQGNLEEAMKMHQKASGIYLEAFGPDHTDVARSYNNMANILYHQGQLEEAMKMHQKALDIRLKALGPDHIDITYSYNNMAIILYHQGNLEDAMKMHQNVLDIRLKALGPNHIDVADSYFNMLIILQNQGNVEEAIKMHQKALDIRLKALGPDHTKVANSYGNMAIILQNQGKLEEAMKMHLKALDIRLKVLGPDHTDVADSYNNIGYVLCQQDRPEEALVECQKALGIQVKAFGENHSDTACTLHSIGEILCKQGKLEEATHFGEKALNMFLHFHGPDHPYTAEGRKLMDMIREKSK